MKLNNVLLQGDPSDFYIISCPKNSKTLFLISALLLFSYYPLPSSTLIYEQTLSQSNLYGLLQLRLFLEGGTTRRST
ncbi:hypothetical protein QVD17_11571 [Tagetes erecta]|uniref:Uncharacterized protein n=1 Tax=Tagetes erecta TaxID=13708 RepID=A0AAD8P111_TARER|nr:hypothetical protein QVD17_11571 [Tagetes erecta]